MKEKNFSGNYLFIYSIILQWPIDIDREIDGNKTVGWVIRSMQFCPYWWPLAPFPWAANTFHSWKEDNRQLVCWSLTIPSLPIYSKANIFWTLHPRMYQTIKIQQSDKVGSHIFFRLPTSKTLGRKKKSFWVILMSAE